MKKVELGFYTKEHLQFLHEMLSDEETKKYFPYMYTTHIDQSRLRLRTRLTDQEWGYKDRFLIIDKKSKEPVGEISGIPLRDKSFVNKKDKYTMELAIIIHPNYRGQGYAKAGTLAFMKHIIKNRKEINKIRLIIADSNKSSLSVANKLEFTFSKMENENMQYWEKDIR